MVRSLLQGVLSQTLLRHLPENLRPLERDFKTRSLAFLAEQNVKKRAELAHPEDVMGVRTLIETVNDLLAGQRATTTSPNPEGFGFGQSDGPLDRRNLQWLVQHGLVRPRYLIRNYDDKGRERGPINRILPPIQLLYNDRGHLKAVKIQPPPKKAQSHRLQWYRERGFLIDFPSPQDVLRTFDDSAIRKVQGSEEERVTPKVPPGSILFIFKQALHVKRVYQRIYVRLNWLHYSPTKYQQDRESVWQDVARLLVEEGLPCAEFCLNTDCRAILPVIGHRKKYCSDECKDPVKNPLKWVRKKGRTDHTEKIEPFEYLADAPFIPSSK